HFPASSVCPYCAAGNCDTVRLGPRGTLFAHTSVAKAPPGYRGKVPYGFGVVELPEAIRVVTRLSEPAVDRLRFGMSMHLVLDDIFVNDAGDVVVGWAFAPESAE
ncbi:MAG: Zn-ribbon domain-containing OB-fold protein, partial [Candidatus Binatia bacterium]